MHGNGYNFEQLPTMENKVFIKNMVCDRCVMVVHEALTRLGLPLTNVNLGEADFSRRLRVDEEDKMSKTLAAVGFEVLKEKKDLLVEKIKSAVIAQVRNASANFEINFSEVLSAALHHDYSYLSNLFSEVEGVTIERYHILQKIEFVKELLLYDELTLNEIAFRLNYSSAAYLSNQFKQITGLTPTQFRKLKGARTALDKV